MVLVFHTPFPFPHPLCGKSGALPWLHAVCLEASPERLFSLWGQETLNLEVLEMERLWGLERTHVFIVLELRRRELVPRLPQTWLQVCHLLYARLTQGRGTNYLNICPAILGYQVSQAHLCSVLFPNHWFLGCLDVWRKAWFLMLEIKSQPRFPFALVELGATGCRHSSTFHVQQEGLAQCRTVATGRMAVHSGLFSKPS